MRRNRAMALALIGAGLATAACTKVGTTGEGSARHNAFTQPHVLRWSDAEDIAGLNPHLVQQSNVSKLAQLTMAWLVRYGHDNEPVPELATQIPTQRNGGISADGKTITWHIRRGVKWSDGVPFDADDVVFSTRVVLNPSNNEVGRDGWDLITRIDEPDKYTVVYHLKKPYASYLPTFFSTGGANPCLLPKHILGNLANINNAPYNALPVGIGPFRYKAWNRGDSVEMERNPYYWRGEPKLERVVFKIIPDRNTVLTQLQAGNLDMWTDVGYGFVDRVRALTGFQTLFRPSTYYDHIDFQTAHAAAADPVVRAALRYATDRPVLREKVSHGVGLLSESVVAAAAISYDKNIPLIPFDLAKANAMLDAAGWKRGADGVRAKNGVRLVFDFASATGSPDTDLRIELIRNWWQRVGAQLNVRHYLTSVLFGPLSQGGIIYSGKFDMVVFAWGGDILGDVSQQYGCNFIPPLGQNVTRYCNRRASDLMEQFKLLYDPAARQPISYAIQEQIVRDAPSIVLDSRQDVYAVNDDVRNFNPSAATSFDDFMNVDT
jgi:peptide/nickel transport system substrate-binding protein